MFEVKRIFGMISQASLPAARGVFLAQASSQQTNKVTNDRPTEQGSEREKDRQMQESTYLPCPWILCPSQMSHILCVFGAALSQVLLHQAPGATPQRESKNMRKPMMAHKTKKTTVQTPQINAPSCDWKHGMLQEGRLMSCIQRPP